MHSTITASRGTTLLEVIFAVTVILVVLTSFLSLFIITNRAQVLDANLSTAAQLAREGTELIRARRDSNWLANRNWYDGLWQAGDSTAIIEVNTTNPGTDAAAADFSVDSIDQAVLYQHDRLVNHQVVDGVATPFARLITIEPICSVDLPPVINACDIDTAVGVRVSSTVQWQSSDQLRQYPLVIYLYAWR